MPRGSSREVDEGQGLAVPSMAARTVSSVYCPVACLDSLYAEYLLPRAVAR